MRTRSETVTSGGGRLAQVAQQTEDRTAARAGKNGSRSGKAGSCRTISPGQNDPDSIDLGPIGMRSTLGSGSLGRRLVCFLAWRVGNNGRGGRLGGTKVGANSRFRPGMGPATPHLGHLECTCDSWGSGWVGHC